MKRTVAILLALMTVAIPALAMTVSAKGGPLLSEAKALGDAGNWKGAMAKLNEAEAVKSYPDDTTVINSMRQWIAKAASHPSQR
jgi:uncharacterized protein YdeI (BOF family)